jgi:hypothetical protein
VVVVVCIFCCVRFLFFLYFYRPQWKQHVELQIMLRSNIYLLKIMFVFYHNFSFQHTVLCIHAIRFLCMRRCHVKNITTTKPQQQCPQMFPWLVICGPYLINMAVTHASGDATAAYTVCWGFYLEPSFIEVINISSDQLQPIMDAWIGWQ